MAGAATAVKFEKLPLGDLSRTVTAADLDRVQQRIVDMAALIPVPKAPNVVTVRGDYELNGTEDVVHVDAQAGPVKIALLAPSSANRPVTIKQVNLQNGKSSVNPVTIVTRDRSKTIAGAAEYTLDDSGAGSASFTADDQQHWPFAGAGGNPPAPPPGGLVYVGVPPIKVTGNVISYIGTPAPPPVQPVSPWVAPISFGPNLYEDQTGAETWRAEVLVDFTGSPSTATLYWWFESLSTAGTGTFQIRIGGSVYRAIDGAVAATWSETNTTLTARSIQVPGFVPPAGVQRVTLTCKSSASGGPKAQIQGANLIIR